MNREEFINKLNESIKNNPDHNEIISYYFELISDKMEAGMTEEEAVSSLGDIDTIIKNINDNVDDDVEFKSNAKDLVSNIENKDNTNTNNDNSNKELSGGKAFALVLWKIATVLFCIAAMALYVFSIILIAISAGFIIYGAIQIPAILSYGTLFIGIGLFILGAGLVGIYYTRFLRKFMFGNRQRWNKMIESKLVGE